MRGQNGFACASIINFPVPAGGQVHGCPFKVMDKDMLKQALDFWGCDKAQAEKALAKSRNKEYQLACKEFYCGCHAGDSGEGVGNHPNQYFAASTNYWAKKNGTDLGGGANGYASIEVPFRLS